MSDDYIKAAAFKRIRIPPLKASAVRGIAITGGFYDGDQVAFVAPTVEAALEAARARFANEFSADGAQDVVILGAAQFNELLRLAGILAEAA